jgi:hypothetical protein
MSTPLKQAQTLEVTTTSLFNANSEESVRFRLLQRIVTSSSRIQTQIPLLQIQPIHRLKAPQFNIQEKFSSSIPSPSLPSTSSRLTKHPSLSSHYRPKETYSPLPPTKEPSFEYSQYHQVINSSNSDEGVIPLESQVWHSTTRGNISSSVPIQRQSIYLPALSLKVLLARERDRLLRIYLGVDGGLDQVARRLKMQTMEKIWTKSLSRNDGMDRWGKDLWRYILMKDKKYGRDHSL